MQSFSVFSSEFFVTQIYTDSGLVRSLEKKHADFADDAVFLFGYLGNFPYDYGKNESV